MNCVWDVYFKQMEEYNKEMEKDKMDNMAQDTIITGGDPSLEAFMRLEKKLKEKLER